MRFAVIIAVAAIVLVAFITAAFSGVWYYVTNMPEPVSFTIEVTDGYTGKNLSSCAQAHFMRVAPRQEVTFKAGADQLIHALVNEGDYDVQFSCPGAGYPVHVNRLEITVEDGKGRIVYMDNDVGFDYGTIKVRLYGSEPQDTPVPIN